MQHSPGFEKLCEAVRKNISEIECETLQRFFKDNKSVILIDVREDYEWDKDHLPHAVHLSKGIIERDIEKQVPDQDTLIVCYCGGGYRSALVADNLQKMGYRNVKSLAGGYRAWCQKKLPLVAE